MALTGSAILSWRRNIEGDLGGYKIYYGTSPGVYGAPIDVGLTATPLTPSYTITGLQADTTYYFAVSSYDNAPVPNEQGRSVEVSLTLRVPHTSITFG